MRIGYVEHPHHQKTNSTNFFINEFVNRGFSLTRIKRDDFSLKEAKTYDLLVLFQADQCITVASESGVKTLVIPMLDEALSLSSKHFRFSEKISFLSFSKVLHDFLTLSGCESTHVQYWPKAEEIVHSRNQELSVFFWERTPEHVREYDVCNWFRNYKCNLYFRKHRDPGHLAGSSPTRAIENGIIRLSGDWLDHGEYLKILSAASVFVAPRRWEGIGLSMLEALVRGIPVVGLNSPTLNEYVINGENGVLVHNKFKSLDIFDFSKMSSRALEMAIQGHEAYKLQINEFLYNFLEGEQCTRRRFATVPERLTLRQYLYVLDGN